MSKYRYVANRLMSKINPHFWHEQEICFGTQNPDKTFYIIRRDSKKAGLFSMYTYVLGHIKYAMKKGWIPIIDMQNYRNTHMNPKQKGKENSWEYYFKQPEDITLDEVYKSAHVVMSTKKIREDMPNISMDFMGNEKVIEEWRKLANRYIPINETVKTMIDEECGKLFGGSVPEDTLGVLLRGTDYVALKPRNHPIQPTIDEAIPEIKRLMQEFNCNKIYLATEDISLLEGIKNEFGNALYYSDVLRYDHNVSGYLSEVKRERDDDHYLKGIDYLIPIGILARCKYFFAGRTSGSVGVLLLNNSLQKSIFWDKGCY